MKPGSGTLEIHTSPHISSGIGTDMIMRHVVYALLPTAIFAVVAFGLAGLATITAAVASCVITEHVLCRLNGRESTVGDWSVAITGLLYGLTLPRGFPSG